MIGGGFDDRLDRARASTTARALADAAAGRRRHVQLPARLARLARMATGACSTTSPCSSGCSARSPRSAATRPGDARRPVGRRRDRRRPARLPRRRRASSRARSCTRRRCPRPPATRSARHRWERDLGVASLRRRAGGRSSRATRRCCGEETWRGTRGAALPTLDRRVLPASPLDAPGRAARHPGARRHDARRGDVPAAHRRPRRVRRAGRARSPRDLFTDAHAALGARARRRRRRACTCSASITPSPDPRLGALHTIDVPLLFGTFATSDVARHYVADDARRARCPRGCSATGRASCTGRTRLGPRKRRTSSADVSPRPWHPATHLAPAAIPPRRWRSRRSDLARLHLPIAGITRLGEQSRRVSPRRAMAGADHELDASADWIWERYGPGIPAHHPCRPCRSDCPVVLARRTPQIALPSTPEVSTPATAVSSGVVDAATSAATTATSVAAPAPAPTPPPPASTPEPAAPAAPEPAPAPAAPAPAIRRPGDRAGGEGDRAGGEGDRAGGERDRARRDGGRVRCTGDGAGGEGGRARRGGDRAGGRGGAAHHPGGRAHRRAGRSGRAARRRDGRDDGRAGRAKGRRDGRDDGRAGRATRRQRRSLRRSRRSCTAVSRRSL